MYFAITNNSFQKKAANYKQDAEDSIWSMERWEEDQPELHVGWVRETLAPQLRAILREVTLACRTELARSPYGCFDLLGVDLAALMRTNL